MLYSKEKHSLLKTCNNLAIRVTKNNLRLLLNPIDYVRTKELPMLLDFFHTFVKGHSLKVLDIASPQILTSHLGSIHPDWNFTYINSFEAEVDEQGFNMRMLCLKNVHTKVADARDSGIFLADYFDAIVSCSVFEHITDLGANRGDSLAAANVAKWLKPGGIFIFSVPFYKKGFEEFLDNAVYKDKFVKNGKVFFQRFYDFLSLQRRIFEPSSLVVRQIKYLGERFFYEGRIDKRLGVILSKGRMKLFLGRLYPLISELFLVEGTDYESLKKPYIAVGLLQKA